MRARCLLLALALAGCKDKAPAPPAPAPPASVSAPPAPAAPDPVASARRPARRYYLRRTAARCEIYFVDPDGVSKSLVTPCPQELLVGERVRIAGKTCVREGGDPDRIEPVVCPDPLTTFELRDRGEKH